MIEDTYICPMKTIDLSPVVYLILAIVVFLVAL